MNIFDHVISQDNVIIGKNLYLKIRESCNITVRSTVTVTVVLVEIVLVWC